MCVELTPSMIKCGRTLSMAELSQINNMKTHMSLSLHHLNLHSNSNKSINLTSVVIASHKQGTLWSIY